MNVERAAATARWVNLLIPGGGLILVGSLWWGLMFAVLFTAAANFAVAGSLLFPDDISPGLGDLSLALAGGCYLGAQLALRRTVVRRRRQLAASLRRQVLRDVRGYLDSGCPELAKDALRPLAELAHHDLLVAYRFAQVLTAVQDVCAARAAWQHVRTLDRHHIYRREFEAAEHALRAATGIHGPDRGSASA